MLTVLLGVLESTVPTSAQAFYDFTAGLTNTSVYGADAVAFAGDVPGYLGWFWVIGPFVMVIMIVLGIFGLKRR